MIVYILLEGPLCRGFYAILILFQGLVEAKLFDQEDCDCNLLKNEFCGRNFENLTRDAESAPPRYYMCLFSGTTDQFDFFGANFLKKKILVSEFQNFKCGFGISTSIIP